jgi:phenylacetate-CoA ligase
MALLVLIYWLAEVTPMTYDLPKNPAQNDGPRKDSSRLDISVVAPCLNEEGNILELTRRVANIFASKKMRGELILVDDGSTDRTYETIQALMKDYPILRVERHPTNLGIEAGWKTGIEAARGRFVCLMDADLHNPPEQVWNLYQEILFSNADLVQGFRSSIGRLRDSRYLLSRGLNIILNTCFGMKLRDNKSGFVIAPKEVLADVIRHRFRYYYFQSFIAVSAASKGYHIREVETLFESRFAGTSFISGNPSKFIYRTLVDVCKGFVEFRLNTKRDNVLADFLRFHHPIKADPSPSIWRRARAELYFWCTRLYSPSLSRRIKLYYEELKRSQWLKPTDVRKLQEAKLRAIVQHAYRHVPFYREMLDSLGVCPEEIQGLDDLRKLPIVDKETVRANLYFNLLSNNHNKWHIARINASGSTCEPSTYFADKHQLEIRSAARLRARDWTGSTFEEHKIRLWQKHVGLTPWEIVREKIRALLSQERLIPISTLSDSTAQNILSSLKSSRSYSIEGSTEVLHWLAQNSAVSDKNRRAFSSISVSGQTLSPDARTEMQVAFGGQVYDHYSTQEFSVVAHQCDSRAGLHVVAESFIVEVLKDGKPALPGEVGEVVITDLNNYCMPLIRYKIGDLAVAANPAEQCSCGRGLPMIRAIAGRSESVFEGSGGRYIPAGFFCELFKDHPYLIQQYQVVQSAPGEIEIRIKKALRFSDQEFAKVLSTMRQHIGNETPIRVEFVEMIDDAKESFSQEAHNFASLVAPTHETSENIPIC